MAQRLGRPEAERARRLALTARESRGQPSLERSVFHLRKDRSILNNLLSLNDPDEGNDLATAQRLSGYLRNDLPKDALTIGYDAGGCASC